jgi:hypothetical protein
MIDARQRASVKEITQTLSRSPIGKAIQYCKCLWHELIEYFY